MKTAKYKLILLTALIAGFLSALLCAPKVVSAFADDDPQDPAVALVDSTEYTTFDQALAAWTDGTTLTLLSDFSTARRLDVSGNKTLDLNGFTLQNAGSGRTLQVEGTLVVKDSSPLNAGKLIGGGIRVNGTLTMESGNITGNSAEDGGGVYIAESGTFVMNGGKVTGNTASGTGGGIYVGGALRLGGMAVVTGNTHEESYTHEAVAQNIYLPAGKTIELSAFTGEAGVSARSLTAIATGEQSAGKLTADNLKYTVIFKESEYLLALSPLEAIEAKYGTKVVYPTTDLQTLKDEFTITARNANGVAYAGNYEITLSGTLAAGDCEITITAKGEDGETAETKVSVPVIAPKLTGITALYKSTGDVYFDTELTALQSALTVTGAYSDGRSRVIFPTAEETSANAQEEYITDHYTLSGDLSDHKDGTANVTVKVGSCSQTVSVAVSKYLIDVSEIPPVPVTIMEQSGEVEAKQFVSALPSGIEVIATLNGKPLQANTLSADVYTVNISFRVIDSDNYEEIEGSIPATLTVNHASISGGTDEAEYTAWTEGGIPLDWDMTITEVSSSVRLEGDMDIKQAVSITLRKNGYLATGKEDRNVTVRLLLSDDLRGKEFALYRVLSDGSTTEIEAKTDGDYVIFETAHLSNVEYVFAVNSGYGMYLALTIVFGVLCLAGAGLLIWYFKARRNMTIK